MWITTVFVFTLLTQNVLISAQKEVNNSLIDPKIKLDPKVRKALLHVLTNLDDENNSAHQNEETDSKETRTFSESDNPAEEKQYLKKIFDVHAFSADQMNEKNASVLPIPNEKVKDEEEEKVNFIISKKYSPIQIEMDSVVASTSGSEAKSSSLNLISKQNVQKTVNVKNFVTAQPENRLRSTTTTAKPESDEINEGKVEEVQFFPAPLVAAFTVHQDERGLPKSVVPLYKDPNAINQEQLQQLQQSAFISISSSNNNNVAKNNIRVTAQQSSLKDQQNLLQQQLYQLQLQEQLRQQEQQRQQDILLQVRQRQREYEEQRRLQQQLEDQRLQQLRLKQDQRLQQLRQQEDQQRLQQLRQREDQQRLQQLRLQQQEEKNRQQQLKIQQEENQRRLQLLRQNLQSTNSFISFQPSVATSQEPLLFQQQLPNREAVDFLANLRRQNLHELPLQQNHIPSNFNQALPPLQQIDLQSPPLFNDPIFNAPSGRNANRVFRHETQTGNFGINPVQNSIVKDFKPQQNYNVADRQLKNLLYQQGLVPGGRQEDLNIVSKVLSLNHFGGDFSGFLRRASDPKTFYFNN